MTHCEYLTTSSDKGLKYDFVLCIYIVFGLQSIGIVVRSDGSRICYDTMMRKQTIDYLQYIYIVLKNEWMNQYPNTWNLILCIRETSAVQTLLLVRADFEGFQCARTITLLANQRGDLYCAVSCWKVAARRGLRRTVFHRYTRRRRQRRAAGTRAAH